MLPSALDISGPENIALIRPMVWGMITAAAAPCTTRNAIRSPAVGAAAQAADATMKPKTPITNSRLRPAMSPSRPPVSNSTANGRV